MRKINFIVIIFFILNSASVFADNLRFKIDMSNCRDEASYAASVGDQIKDPLLRKFHKILMDNELSGGCGALQFTDAEMASQTNGFSFGLSQFDLATRPSKSMSTLNTIIACASEEAGMPVLSVSDLAFLHRLGSEPTSRLKADNTAWQRFGQMREPIEKSLRSQCGRNLLAKEYLRELSSFLPPVAALWQSAMDDNPSISAAETLYKLYALDLQNVLGGVDNLRNYIIDRREIVCFSLCQAKVVPVFSIKGEAKLTDFIRYPFQATCYGFVPEATRRFDALRRLNRVLVEVDISALPLTEEDRGYLTNEFADMLASSKLATSKSGSTNLELGRLEELVTNANFGVPIVGKAIPLDPKDVLRAQALCKQ